MDLGLIIFISCIVVLGLIILIFHLFNKKIVQKWWKKRKDTKEIEKDVEDEEKKKKKKKDKDKDDDDESEEEEKKEVKKKVSKRAKKKAKSGKRIGGGISYWKFILAISSSILISIIFVYLVVWAVKGIWDFNLISYILT